HCNLSTAGEREPNLLKNKNPEKTKTAFNEKRKEELNDSPRLTVFPIAGVRGPSRCRNCFCSGLVGEKAVLFLALEFFDSFLHDHAILPFPTPSAGQFVSESIQKR